MLRQVQSDRSNLAHGWLPFAAVSIRQQFGTQMPQGGHPPHHSITSPARASSVAAENADNGPGLLRARGLRTEDRFRRRTTESQDERAPSLTRIKGVFRSRAASSPAAPIYFPTTFRSASFILSCQPGPAS